RIVLDAPSVDLQSGSVVDIRGGGDLFAWEHVPGPGGSHDVLNRAGVYAIIPSLGNVVAPADPWLAVGDRVWLAGGGGLTAGWYTLLPARYALLPGAYAVSVVAGTEGRTSAPTYASTDGSFVMSGYRGNSMGGGQQQTVSSWRMMSGSVVRQYS